MKACVIGSGLGGLASAPEPRIMPNPQKSFLHRKVPIDFIEQQLCYTGSECTLRPSSQLLFLKQTDMRPLSQRALMRKMRKDCAGFLKNFSSICTHMVEKCDEKDARKGHVPYQSTCRNRSHLGRLALYPDLYLTFNHAAKALETTLNRHFPKGVSLE